MTRWPAEERAVVEAAMAYRRAQRALPSPWRDDDVADAAYIALARAEREWIRTTDVLIAIRGGL